MNSEEQNQNQQPINGSFALPLSYENLKKIKFLRHDSKLSVS